jgi:hypothetical protein
MRTKGDNMKEAEIIARIRTLFAETEILHDKVRIMLEESDRMNQEVTQLLEQMRKGEADEIQRMGFSDKV